MDEYLDGGNITKLSADVQRAANKGRVQTGTRTLKTKDHQRYLQNTCDVFWNRLERIDAIGPEQVKKALKSMTKKERNALVDALEETRDEINSLLRSARSIK